MRRHEFVKHLQNQTRNYFSEHKVKTAKCGYILDSYENWPHNIILPDVADYIKRTKEQCMKAREPFPIHKYIHHGLSSQACLFNLLGRIVSSENYLAIQQLLLDTDIFIDGKICKAQFEYADRSVFDEKQGQPTSIDLFIETDKSERLFIEFKFTESGFGGCSVYENGDCDGLNPALNNDLCFLHRIGRKYLTLMKSYGLFIDGYSCQLIDLYQAYRILITALEHNGHFLLIHDERNPAFCRVNSGMERGKFILFRNMLPDSIKNRLHILSIQKIVNNLERQTAFSWIKEFKAKYMQL